MTRPTIDRALRDAVLNGKPLSRDNTRVTVNTREDGARITRVYLHGNLIAQTGKNGTWGFKFAGWLTPTTRDRINVIRDAFHLPRVSIAKGHAPDARAWFS